MPKFPNRYSVSKRGSRWGDVFSFGKYSAVSSSQRSPWSGPSERKGCSLPSSALQGSAFTDAGRRTKGRLYQPVPHRPRCWASSIPMPITWSLRHKSLLIILILNIKLKWKVHFRRLGSIHIEKRVLCKQVGQALAPVDLWFSTWLHIILQSLPVPPPPTRPFLPPHTPFKRAMF